MTATGTAGSPTVHPDPRVYPDYGCLSKVYENGETVTNEYVLWDDYRVGGYLDPGTYRWEEQVNITTADETDDGDEKLGSFHWGFDVEVAVPDDA